MQSRFGCSIGRCLLRLCKKSKKNGLRGKIFRKIEEKNVTEMLSSATMMNLFFFFLRSLVSKQQISKSSK